MPRSGAESAPSRAMDPRDPAARRAVAEEPASAGVEAADLEARQEAMSARERAETLKAQLGSAADSGDSFASRGDAAFEEAEVARFNSRFRAARELYTQASEFYELAHPMTARPTASDRAENPEPAGRGASVSAGPLEIPAYAPVDGASPESVDALFREVDRVQREAYTGGGLRAAPDLIKEADAELWDAQIAVQVDDYAAAFGHLKRIIALYGEAHRLARSSGAAPMSVRATDPVTSETRGPSASAPSSGGPLVWVDSYATALERARSQGRPVMLLLYDRVQADVVGLFSDESVRASAAQVVACKHRVTEVLAGLDASFLSESDRKVKALIDAYSLHSYPTLLLAGADGELIETASRLDRQSVLELLEEAR